MKKTYVILLLLFITLLASTPGIQAATSYRVKSGDTLWQISQRYQVPMKVITRLNNINDVTNLYPGQRLIISNDNNQITISIEDSNTSNNFINYTVKHGDSLWKIAQKYQVSIDEIVAHNSIDSNYSVYIGQVLRIPVDNNSSDNGNSTNYIYYTIKSGDILWNIAQKFNTTVKELVELNDIQDAYDLYVGRRLLIPQRGNTEPEDNNNNNNNGQINIPYYFYRFQKDDQIWKVADNFDIRASVLIRFNNISDINNIPEDSIIIIPLNKSSKYSYIRNAASQLNNYYRVRSGETLSEIADYFQIPEEGLRAINNLTESEGVYAGQKLKMPVSPALFKKHQLYRVTSEKYLFDIAYEKGVSISSILKANYLRNPNLKFKPGETIIVTLDEASKATWIDYENGKPKSSWLY